MGKKKSKTAKKKQAKAASRAKQAKAFGVSVVKGSKGRGTSSGSAPAGGGGGGDNGRAASGSSNHAAMEHDANSKGGSFGPSTGSRRRQEINKDDERNDFDRDHASLQERTDARRRQQQRSGGKKRGSRKHQQQQKEAQSSSLFSNLAQSSIRLGPATVGEMVDDAANRVASGMTGFGAALSPVGGMTGRPTAPPNTPSALSATGDSGGGGGGGSTLLQVLAAKKRQEWSAQKYMLPPESNSDNGRMGDNRFASLGNGDSDSDGNGWGADSGKKANGPPAFQFAPASFAFGGGGAGGGGGPQLDAVDDPDL